MVLQTRKGQRDMQGLDHRKSINASHKVDARNYTQLAVRTKSADFATSLSNAKCFSCRKMTETKSPILQDHLAT